MRSLAVARPTRLGLRLVLALLLAAAAVLRLYGIAWDGGLLFHPDERHILTVVNRLSFPPAAEWGTLLTPESPWNPAFFAYGSFPLYLLRVMADLAGRFDPRFATLESSYLVGRTLSALFDLGSVALVYRLAERLYDERVGLLAALFTTLTVLHVQLAHFYAVDTLLAFFVLLTVDLAVDLTTRPTLGRSAVVGVAWGVALATKVSAAPLGLVVAAAWLFGVLASRRDPANLRIAWTRAITGVMVAGGAALATFALLEPYAIIDPVTFAGDIAQEGEMARGVFDVPYTRQFIGTLPYIYPIRQAIVWSMGLPLGITGFVALGVAAVRAALEGFARRWKRMGELVVPLAWVLPYLAIVGSFHAKFLRYLLPILPFLSIWAAWMLLSLVRREQRMARAVGWGALGLVVAGSALYAVGYLNVYAQEHPWIRANAWLCGNLPAPSRIAIEHWDDPLPLPQAPSAARCYRQHRLTQVAVYNRDDETKRDLLLDALRQNDYIVLASNRLYNTIPRLPGRYPFTSRYYELLMGEELGYELVYTAATYPRVLGVDLVHDTFHDPDLPKPRLLQEVEAGQARWVIGRADESYSVYDHPMVLVFKKVEDLSRAELLERFGEAAIGLPKGAGQ